jgi:hypothetical protein
MHLHADDATVHAATPEAAHQILASSVDLHCQATGAKLQRTKNHGLGLGSASHLAGVEPIVGVTFVEAGTSFRHLGIPLQRDADAAATELYTRILQKLVARTARWSGFHLSLSIRAQLAALQAKIIARLLEPECLTWKAFFDFWLLRSSAWLEGQATPPPARQQHAWQLGRFLPFSAYDLTGMAVPSRVVQYITAFRQLRPHQLQPPQAFSYQEIMGQPLFHNRSILEPATGQPSVDPLSPATRRPRWPWPPLQHPDETADVAFPPPQPRPAWSSVWQVISSSDLDRAARVTA